MTEIRQPHEIISDLLWFAEMDPSDLEHPEAYDVVKAEARLYLAEVLAEKAAWDRLEKMSRDLFGGRNCRLRYDPGL